MDIRNARPDEFDLVCDILVDGFFRDPILSPVFPDLSRRAASLRGFFRVTAAPARDAGTILISGDNGGVLVYMTPDTLRQTAERESQDRLCLQQECGADGSTAVAFMDALAANHPTGPPHNYVFLLAVRHRLLGGYVGPHLVRHLVDLLDSEGMPAYAEVTNLIARDLAYVLGWQEMENSLQLPNGQRLWRLWRMANTSAGTATPAVSATDSTSPQRIGTSCGTLQAYHQR